MVFPLAAVIGAVASVGSSVIGGIGQKKAADAANAEQERIEEEQQKRWDTEYAIDNLSKTAQWYWDQARIEELRANEAQIANDTAVAQGKQISAAITGYNLNLSSLFDDYIVGETLRAKQEVMGYQYSSERERLQSEQRMGAAVAGMLQTSLQGAFERNAATINAEQALLASGIRADQAMLNTIVNLSQSGLNLNEAIRQASITVATTDLSDKRSQLQYENNLNTAILNVNNDIRGLQTQNLQNINNAQRATDSTTRELNALAINTQENLRQMGEEYNLLALQGDRAAIEARDTIMQAGINQAESMRQTGVAIDRSSNQLNQTLATTGYNAANAVLQAQQTSALAAVNIAQANQQGRYEAARLGLDTAEDIRRAQFQADQALLEGQIQQDRLYAQSVRTIEEQFNALQQEALRGDLVRQQVENANSELMGSLVLDEQRDYLLYEARMIQGALASAEARGQSVIRQGGGATAQRLALQSAAEVGRSFQELVNRSTNRDLRAALLQNQIRSETATQMALSAMQMENIAGEIAYVADRYGAESAWNVLQANQLIDNAMGAAGYAQSRYGVDLANIQDALSLRVQEEQLRASQAGDSAKLAVGYQNQLAQLAMGEHSINVMDAIGRGQYDTSRFALQIDTAFASLENTAFSVAVRQSGLQGQAQNTLSGYRNNWQGIVNDYVGQMQGFAINENDLMGQQNFLLQGFGLNAGNLMANRALDYQNNNIAMLNAAGGVAAQADQFALDTFSQQGRYNLDMQTEQLSQAGTVADYMNRMNYNLSSQAIQLGQQGQTANIDNQLFALNADERNRTFTELTVPSFQLAQNQLARELDFLQITTGQTLDDATIAYRPQEFLDPLKPVAGLKPEVIAGTRQEGPSFAAIVGDALLGGVSGAMKFYDSESGTFR